jgi:hypothetical protein
VIYRTEEAPTGLLGWFVRPERGLATFDDGSSECLVRISDGRFLSVVKKADDQVERIRINPTRFETSPQC